MAIPSDLYAPRFSVVPASDRWALAAGWIVTFKASRDWMWTHDINEAMARLLSRQMNPKPYRPGSGTEGADFMARWCDRCKRDEAFRHGTGDSCPIAANTLAFDIDDPGYPKEWRYGADGRPVCLAFEEV